MNTAIASPAAPARASFLRLAARSVVSELVKEAKRVGYQVTFNGGKTVSTSFSLTVTDHSPEAVTPGAMVFRAVNTGRGAWGITYSTAYWSENLPTGERTPANFAAYITARP